LGAANTRAQIACERGLGKSMTRVQPAATGSAHTWTLAITPARFVEWWGITKIDLIKIDIEGGEFDLAPALIKLFPRIKPAIHLSLHAPFFPKPARHDKLAVIAELAERYAFCYDGELRRIAPEEILGGKFAEGFETVVFADGELW
ncbi:MAG: FkbM family methyltransferase, partial [Gammaproteobacteria bacterium]